MAFMAAFLVLKGVLFFRSTYLHLSTYPSLILFLWYIYIYIYSNTVKRT